jgi:fructose-bisphosphate aldolase class I
MARCQQVTGEVLGAVFAALGTQHVLLEGMILKPNMVLPGADCPEQVSVAAVAEATVTCLLRSVPAALPGIAFLSGGQSGERAAANLNAMQSRSAPAGRLPWTLAFSFARAIQFPALTIWRGDQAQRPAAQQALLHRAHCSAAAMQGTYDGVLDVA